MILNGLQNWRRALMSRRPLPLVLMRRSGLNASMAHTVTILQNFLIGQSFVPPVMRAFPGFKTLPVQRHSVILSLRRMRRHWILQRAGLTLLPVSFLTGTQSLASPFVTPWLPIMASRQIFRCACCRRNRKPVCIANWIQPNLSYPQKIGHRRKLRFAVC